MMPVGDMGRLSVCNTVSSRPLFNHSKAWLSEWSWLVFTRVWDALSFGSRGGSVLGDSCVCLASMAVSCAFFLVYPVSMQLASKPAPLPDHRAVDRKISHLTIVVGREVAADVGP